MIAAAPEQTLDYDRLRSLAARDRSAYARAEPYPHIVIDDAVEPARLDRVLDEFPGNAQLQYWRRNVAHLGDMPMQAGKLGFSAEHVMSGHIRNLLWELNSSPFIRFLEALTGIANLIPDPLLRGGGLHQIEPGGVLGIHADFTGHPQYALDRRLNLLLFLNRDWQDEYNGHLELWSKDLSRCVRSIRPLFARMVIFNTDISSFHGHPLPLACPPGMTRRSIALYYYTHGRDDDTVVATPDTDWRATPLGERPPHE